MGRARRNCHRRSPCSQIDWADTSGRLIVADSGTISVSQPPVRGFTPAEHTPVIENCTRVFLTRRDGLGGPARSEIHKTIGSRRLVVADRVGVSIPECSGCAGTPTFHEGIVENCTRVVRARCNCHCRAARAEIDGPDTCGGFGVADSGGVAIAKLARKRISPAGNLCIVEDRARVRTTRRDGGRRTARAKVHGPNARRSLVVTDPVRVAVSELPGTSGPPALHFSIVQNHTCVRGPCRDCRGSSPGTEIHGANTRWTLVVTDRIRIGVSELPTKTGSPTLHARIIENHTRVTASTCDCHRSAACAEADRPGSSGSLIITDRVEVAITKRTIAADSPTIQRLIVENHTRMAGTCVDVRGLCAKGAGRATGNFGRHLTHRHDHQSDKSGQPENTLELTRERHPHRANATPEDEAGFQMCVLADRSALDASMQ